jgi:hypothetical protein
VTAQLRRPQTYGKALVAGCGAIVTGLTAGSADGRLTAVEAVLAVLVGLGAAAGVFAAPANADVDDLDEPAGRHAAR